MKRYIVATRPSQLAYTQTLQIVDLLKRKNPDCEFEVRKFSTHGDRVTDKPLTSFGGTGVFVKELEDAILSGKADFAVHSLKDVPSNQPEGLTLASFSCREDPRDVLLTRNGKGLHDLQGECVIGTGSPRRILQIMLQKPDARFADLRGNIDTRINKLMTGGYDAILLAAAALNRLGIEFSECSCLPIDICLPAVGQGALTMECRNDDPQIHSLLRSINDEPTEIAVLAERSFMRTIGGGCKFPLAAYATISKGSVHLQTMVGDHLDGRIVGISDSAPAEQAEDLGIRLANRIQMAAKEKGIVIGV